MPTTKQTGHLFQHISQQKQSDADNGGQANQGNLFLCVTQDLCISSEISRRSCREAGWGGQSIHSQRLSQSVRAGPVSGRHPTRDGLEGRSTDTKRRGAASPDSVVKEQRLPLDAPPCAESTAQFNIMRSVNGGRRR